MQGTKSKPVRNITHLQEVDDVFVQPNKKDLCKTFDTEIIDPWRINMIKTVIKIIRDEIPVCNLKPAEIYTTLLLCTEPLCTEE